MMSMLELSKSFMSRTGGDMMDTVISDVPIVIDAMNKNDMKT